jgi:hypothetical protein
MRHKNGFRKGGVQLYEEWLISGGRRGTTMGSDDDRWRWAVLGRHVLYLWEISVPCPCLHVPWLIYQGRLRGEDSEIAAGKLRGFALNSATTKNNMFRKLALPTTIRVTAHHAAISPSFMPDQVVKVSVTHMKTTPCS